MRIIIVSIFTLLLFSCNENSNRYTADSAVKITSYQDTALANLITGIDSLFSECNMNETVYYSVFDSTEHYTFSGRKVDTLTSYQLLDSFLTFRAISNSDFFAVCKFSINDSSIAYIWRIPSSSSSSLLSLFVYSKKQNKFVQRLDIANMVGDEGYVYSKYCKIYSKYKLELFNATFKDKEVIDSDSILYEWGNTLNKYN